MYILGPTFRAGSTMSFKIILDNMIERGLHIIIIINDKNKNIDFINYGHSKKCVIEELNLEMSILPKPKNINDYIKLPYRLIKKLYHLYKSKKNVEKIICKYKPDIVHTNVGVYHQAYKFCYNNNIPHIWHLREYQTKGLDWIILPSKRMFEKRLQKSNVITVSEDIKKHFNLTKHGKSISLWNGILSKKEHIYIHEKEPYFLFATRISKQKNIELLINAFDNISDKLQKYKIIIAGAAEDEMYLENLKQWIDSLNCKDRIQFLNYRDDITELMKKATALIVSSNYEGLGRMTLEATFMGCLVIGRNNGGTKEILSKTNNGILFNTVSELSESMIYVDSIVKTNEYKKRILTAQNIIIDKCCNENYTETIYSYYKSILNN
ncbi:glycosyltransferase [Acetobacteroides hydrogenigenes]|uniref:Glycosyltransferase involved in cell wall biosynthesis n=1 Tax=Acetobacteroides hydrogenigenes TaxID=979970 RepID=A0A4R2EX36_9BACT|nr:glycosyltransferase [Acetobacteroides hydrogenigenes]TCN72132.1 glycosyltransferase involved in cell wall biosynthesis [Acetobacteroides hydrogenigenes]